MFHSNCKASVCIILDIDNTLLSACQRFSAWYPFPTSSALSPQHRLSYYDVERGRWVRDCVITIRPHLEEFLRRVGSELNTSRVKVDVGLFTRNTPSYAQAIAEQVVRPLMPVPLAFTFGSAHCSGPEGRKKSLAVTGSPATSLLVDDSCASFLADEFFSGRGALVQPFFSGVRPWGPDDEMDNVLFSGEQFDFPPHTPTHQDDDRLFDILTKGEGGDEENITSLSALIQEFVVFWHNNIHCITDPKINLLKDSRAAQYRRRWYEYHAPLDERLECVI